MKKTAATLLVVGGVFSLLGMLVFIGLSTFFFALGDPALLEQILYEGGQSSTAEELAAISSVIRIFAIVILVLGLFSLPGAIVSFIAAKKQTLGSFIGALVLSILCLSLFGLIGGIMGTAAASKDTEKAQESEEDATSTEEVGNYFNGEPAQEKQPLNNPFKDGITSPKKGKTVSLVIEGVIDDTNQFAIIEAIQDIANISLMDAKRMVEQAPSTIKAGLEKEKAAEYKYQLEELGAKILIK